MKFEKFGILFAGVNVEITSFVESKKKKISDHLNNIELTHSVNEIQKHGQKLKEQNDSMKEENKVIRMEPEDVQQYVRKQNVRILGVNVIKNETSAAVESVVKQLMHDSNMVIPNVAIDRAHRVGKVKKEMNGNATQPIIVRFTSFRDRTRFYEARKDIKSKFKYGISLDLTKIRLGLLNEARKMVDNVEGINFVYSDVNCNLKPLTSNGKHLSFRYICDLQVIIANL